jgi:hypothetical protein
MSDCSAGPFSYISCSLHSVGLLQTCGSATADKDVAVKKLFFAMNHQSAHCAVLAHTRRKSQFYRQTYTPGAIYGRPSPNLTQPRSPGAGGACLRSEAAVRRSAQMISIHPQAISKHPSYSREQAERRHGKIPSMVQRARCL